MKNVNGFQVIMLVLLAGVFVASNVVAQDEDFSKKVNMNEIVVTDFDSVITADGIELHWYVNLFGMQKEMEIERSLDNMNFETLDVVFGSVIDSEITKFIYYDFNVPKGYYYYRLKYKNDNGTVRYSKSVFINATEVVQSVLEQNTPNPFNPVTSIQFRLAARNKVSLRVYNILGQLINTLMDGYVEKGVYTVRWDGYDMTGREVPAGVYFYQILIGRYAETRRMILVR